jgi:hypothetical protein
VEVTMLAQRRGRARVVVALHLSVLMAACVSAGGSPESSRSMSMTPSDWDGGSLSTSSSSVLTAADLARTRAWSTPEAILRLRPEFLRGSSRMPTVGQPQIAVYLNRAYAGDVTTLSTIPLEAVRTVTFLQPAEALIRFGTICQCANGAIVVTTRLR